MARETPRYLLGGVGFSKRDDRFLAELRERMNSDRWRLAIRFTGPRQRGAFSTTKAEATSRRVYLENSRAAQEEIEAQASRRAGREARESAMRGERFAAMAEALNAVRGALVESEQKLRMETAETRRQILKGDTLAARCRMEQDERRREIRQTKFWQRAFIGMALAWAGTLAAAAAHLLTSH